MKYVIEIKSEFEDSFKGLMILGAKESNLYVDTLAVENLEPLTAEYINKHFGELLKSEYHRGLEEGYRNGQSVGENSANDKLSEQYQKGLEEGRKEAKAQAQLDVCHDIENVAKGNYNKGLEDAWKCARKICAKISDGGFDYDTLDDIFESRSCATIMVDYSVHEALAKLTAYEEKQKEDAFCNGDEVEHNSNPEIKVLVTDVDDEERQFGGLALTFSAHNCDIGDRYSHCHFERWHKTGRHYDIAALLEKMKGE